MENHSSRPPKCRRTFLHTFRNLCLRQVRLSAVAQNRKEVFEFAGSDLSQSPVICFPVYFLFTLAALVSVADSIKSIKGALHDLICDTYASQKLSKYHISAINNDRKNTTDLSQSSEANTTSCICLIAGCTVLPVATPMPPVYRFRNRIYIKGLSMREREN